MTPRERELHDVVVSGNGYLQTQQLTEEAKLPLRATTESAGLDLYATDRIIIPPHSRALVSTGLKIKPPPGTYSRIASRSSMALKGIDAQARVIDCDYRGEVKVILSNATDLPYTVNISDQIAQLIVERILLPAYITARRNAACIRAQGGFGSTGR
ncbi:dUTP diphosphatase [Laetiporus sulphureus 93-53]|uniref:Deoxyuridine 5'-triphosphate nucleotidohydrolase n=1 Tax=Laetiporus sulphureus 93-53 TaxID=1314785 RepID=A0A165BW94_9APHY|nr:dUTP diphosphatase [Laetiporus sulphureus 93-53]KZT01765.1 dUTP diphosphatase [Laetiporus sulphureus 93-53]